eukprot:TRINITY_DN11023_c0_g1_i1.p2 TRINITY_DN11023_c0_g1~~TRINITY_DN11023_c0_g1_i1.p2  ORF type:complete len:296 (-),score=81.44 TRINITY_DN11023_c0_g1_i1:198-1046(-)
MDNLTKVVKTAVVIIPPESVWGPIQRIRELHDKSYRRWMPHINLLYPFVSQSSFDDVLPALKQALSAFQPFQVTLAAFEHFTHRGSCTIWLRPDVDRECAGQLQRLQQALERAVPVCDDLSHLSAAGFTPHLSVGQWSKTEVEQASHELQSGWQPLSFQVSQAFVIARNTFDEPFRVHVRLPLGGEPVERLQLAASLQPRNSSSSLRVFVGNVAASVTNEQLYEFFALQAVRPVSAVVVHPRGRGTCYGFVEFSSADDQQRALTLTGSKLAGLPVQIQLPRA